MIAIAAILFLNYLIQHKTNCFHIFILIVPILVRNFTCSFTRHGTPLGIRQPIEQVQLYTDPVDCQG